MGVLKRFLGESSNEDQFELIINELTDSPDKVFIWQFPDFSDEDLDRLLDEGGLADIISHEMQSHHVLTTSEVEIDELIMRDGNPIAVRDDIYHVLREEEEDGTAE